MRFLIPVLLAVVVLFFTNLVANEHFHILASGELIQHSHPFSNNCSNGDDGYPGHQHSTAEIILLTTISGKVFLDFLFIVPVLPAGESSEIAAAVYIPQKTAPCYCPIHDTRAPPLPLVDS